MCLCSGSELAIYDKMKIESLQTNTVLMLASILLAMWLVKVLTLAIISKCLYPIADEIFAPVVSASIFHALAWHTRAIPRQIHSSVAEEAHCRG